MTFPAALNVPVMPTKKLQQVIVAMSGSFDVTLDDGFKRKKFHLNRSYYGLYLGQEIWRELDNFSSGSVCMVLASEYYEEADYYRDYEEFVAIIHSKRQHCKLPEKTPHLDRSCK